MTIEDCMYEKGEDGIEIMFNDGSVRDISQASDMLNISILSRKVKKYYICYYRFDE